MAAIDIESLGLGENGKAYVLAALFNSARVAPTFICSVQNMEFVKNNGSPNMTLEMAKKILDDHGDWIDYLYGRPLKLNFANHPLDTRLYERDNGHGAADQAIYNSLDLLP